MNNNKRKNLRKIAVVETIAVLLVVNFLLITHLDKTVMSGMPVNEEVKVQKTMFARNTATTKKTEKPIESKEPVKDKKKELSDAAKKVAATEKEQTLILVNAKKAIPDDYKVEFGTYKKQGCQIAKLIESPLTTMLKDGEKKGLSFNVCSAYRSNDYQKRLFMRDVNRYKMQGLSDKDARAKAAFSVQPPKHSEHATGFAVDIISWNNGDLDKSQEETEEFKWLKKNCSKYGFILRYPDGKSKITGIIYEPWHFRYVGKEVAKFITDNKLTFEEFKELTK